MQTGNQESPVKIFLRKCYEIGNTPLGKLAETALKSSNSVAPQTSSEERRGSFTLNGALQPGVNARYAINQTDFDVDADTWVIGILRVGAIVRVRGISKPGFGRYATQITIEQ